MSPKLKKVLILMVVLMIVVFGGLALSMVFSNMSTVTISDLKILDENGKIMKDKNVYITETDSNSFKFSVSMKADGSSGGYYPYSTDKKVANVVWKNDSYYVEYYNSGVATIVVQSYAIAGLRDSFKVVVHENYNVDLAFSDSKAQDKKSIDIFADNKDYSYKFDLIGSEEEFLQNSRLLRVSEVSNPNLFNTLEVDSATNSLHVNVKRELNGNIVQSSNEYAIIQSCIRDSKGNLVVKDNYIVKLNIVCNSVEDLQIEFCDNYDFESDKRYVLSMLADEAKAEYLINTDTEVLLRKVYVSKGIQTFYFKVRLVFANKEILYVTKSCTYGLNSSWLETQNQIMDADEYVYTFNFPTESLENLSFSITLPKDKSPSREDVVRTFTFAFVEEGEKLDIGELYELKDGVYTYTYFDTRLKRFDTITDENGKILKFVDPTHGLKFNIVRDSNGVYISSYSSVTTTPIEEE